MKTIDINFCISGTKIAVPFKAICSITDKKFKGDIIIEYHPNKKVVEYIDLSRVVKDIVKRKLTVEELTHKVFKAIEASIFPKYLKVLIDVYKSNAHQPVQVWIEKNFK